MSKRTIAIPLSILLPALVLGGVLLLAGEAQASPRQQARERQLRRHCARGDRSACLALRELRGPHPRARDVRLAKQQRYRPQPQRRGDLRRLRANPDRATLRRPDLRRQAERDERQSRRRRSTAHPIEVPGMHRRGR